MINFLTEWTESEYNEKGMETERMLRNDTEVS